MLATGEKIPGRPARFIAESQETCLYPAKHKPSREGDVTNPNFEGWVFLIFPQGKFFYGVLILVRDLVLCATFVALAVALGFALVHMPNVELVTLVAFMSGYLLGASRGFLIGFISMAFFTILNPLGIPVVPVVAAQVGGMAVIGFVGGLTKRWSRGWIQLGHRLPRQSTLLRGTMLLNGSW